MTNPLILNIPHSSTYLPCDAIYIPDSINQASGGRAYAKAKIRKKHEEQLFQNVEDVFEGVSGDGVKH